MSTFVKTMYKLALENNKANGTFTKSFKETE